MQPFTKGKDVDISMTKLGKSDTRRKEQILNENWKILSKMHERYADAKFLFVISFILFLAVFLINFAVQSENTLIISLMYLYMAFPIFSIAKPSTLSPKVFYESISIVFDGRLSSISENHTGKLKMWAFGNVVVFFISASITILSTAITLV